MSWTLEAGRDRDALIHKVVDRDGQEVTGVRAVKRVPLFGVIVERFVERDGGYVIAPDGDDVLTRWDFIWRGAIVRLNDYR